MNKSLFYYGLPAGSLPWKDKEDQLNAAQNLHDILRKEAAGCCRCFITNAHTQADLEFAEQVLQLKLIDTDIHLHVSMPFEYQDGLKPRRDAVLSKAAVVRSNTVSTPLSEFENNTALAKKADIFVSPLEKQPRDPVSVMLARIAMENGAELVYYDHIGIQRLQHRKAANDAEIMT
jgi:hypothetical protein